MLPLRPPADHLGDLDRPTGRRRSRRWAALAIGGVVVAGGVTIGVLTHDDGQAPTFAQMEPEDIARAMKLDMQIPTTIRVTGNVPDEDFDITFDLQITSSGDCDGSLAYGGATSLIRRVAGQTWLKPTEAFWETVAPSPAVAQLDIDEAGDDWVKIDPAGTGLARQCSIGAFFEYDQSANTYQTIGTAQVDGQSVVQITETESSGTATLSVLEQSPHYLVEARGFAGSGDIKLSDFDRPFAAHAPPSDQVTSLPTG